MNVRPVHHLHVRILGNAMDVCQLQNETYLVYVPHYPPPPVS